MNRDQARKAFADAGLTFDSLSKSSVQRLRALINTRMKSSGAIENSFRCKQRGVYMKTPNGNYAEIKCRAFYFDSREAISFNRDGFIGFAGWADDRNVLPIIDGFLDWVSELSNQQRSS